MSSNNGLIVFLVDVVSPLVKNLTAFLIVASLIEGYILTAYTDAIFDPYIFIYNSSILSLRSDYWTMVLSE